MSSTGVHGHAVGVVGLGAMGAPIAGHLLRAGMAVVVADLDEQAVRAATEDGAAVADDLVDLARQCDVVLVVVPSDEDVLAVCVAGGLLAACRPGTAVLLCSSVRPDTCDAVLAAAPERVGVLDAALTGGVRGARTGRINLLVGGDRDVLDRVRPVLEPWTDSVHHLGRLGAGQVGKTVNNLVHWAQICAITEALELGRRYGLDVPTLRRALFDGPTDSRTLREMEQMRFTWYVKDLANAQTMAAAVDLPLPVATTSRAVMDTVTVPAVAELLEASPEPS